MESDRQEIIKVKLRQVAEMDVADRQDCVHLDQIEEVVPNSDVCEACIALGDTWVNLRICMICGQVGCCDDSKNTHARKHFKAAGHPIIMSFQPGEDWLWCYVDEALFI